MSVGGVSNSLSSVCGGVSNNTSSVCGGVCVSNSTLSVQAKAKRSKAFLFVLVCFCLYMHLLTVRPRNFFFRHVHNTGDIGDFCIEKLKGVGQGRKSVYCVTGELARKVS